MKACTFNDELYRVKPRDIIVFRIEEGTVEIRRSERDQNLIDMDYVHFGDAKVLRLFPVTLFEATGMMTLLASMAGFEYKRTHRQKGEMLFEITKVFHTPKEDEEKKD